MNATGEHPENVESDSLADMKMSAHYVVGKICEEIGAKYDVTMTKDFIATLAGVVFEEILSFAFDLELFSRHAKRTTIMPEDIKLLVRKSPSLVEYMEKYCADIIKHKKEKKKESVTENIDLNADNSNSNFENLADVQLID